MVGIFLAALIAGAIGNILFGLLTLLIVAGVIAFIWLFYYKNQVFKEKAMAEISKTLIGRKLSDELIRISQFAPKLTAADEFGWRVVHSDDFADNFEAILREYEGRDGETVESFEAVLVCEPANPLNPNAIAVTWFGFVMGYLAKSESAELFAFLMKRGGVARCNATVKFDASDNASAARIDVQKPFRFET